MGWWACQTDLAKPRRYADSGRFVSADLPGNPPMRSVDLSVTRPPTATWPVWTTRAGPPSGGQVRSGLAGSRGFADPRPTTCKHGQNQRPATRDPRYRATRAARAGPDICKIPGPARTSVRMGILKSFFLLQYKQIHSLVNLYIFDIELRPMFSVRP